MSTFQHTLNMASTDDSLKLVLERLDGLAQAVRRLEKRERLPSALASPSKRSELRSPRTEDDSESLNATGSDDPFTSEEEERARHARPSMYPHTPRRRIDTLEATARRHRDAEGLDFLVLKEMQGLYNLSALLLVFALGYITMRNIYEKGLLLDPVGDFLCPEAIRDWGISAMICGTALALTACVFLAQRATVSGWISHSALFWTYGTLQAVSVVGCSAMVYLTPIGPFSAAGALCIVLILAIKSHSYVFTNYALARERLSPPPLKVDAPPTVDTKPSTVRKRHRPKAASQESAAHDDNHDDDDDDDDEGKITLPKGFSPYPGNVTVADFAFFLVCPSLVYEPYYPRVKRRRWNVILNKTAEFLICALLQYGLLRQFLLPVLSKPHPAGVIMDVAKLAIPSLILWLLGFYSIFVCALGITAELLQMADARFYDAWWSATSIDAFWRLWNLPVHEWMLRHAYFETIHYAHFGKKYALFFTFLLSAVVHEIVFSVSFKTARPWFFLGMLGQIPLITLSKRFQGTRRGNFIVWLSLFLGQPLIELLYFREWMAEHNGQFFCVSDA
jgi:hypothetical protein